MHPESVPGPGTRAAPPRLAVARIEQVLTRVPSGYDWMSESERQRFAAFGSSRRRDEYRAGHWLLREVVAEVLGGVVADVLLDDRPGAPPALASTGSGLSLALSHSQAWVAAGCGRGRIGLDIEQRPRTMAEHIRALLREADDAEEPDDDHLLARWAVKEAWIKADLGSALPETLQALSVRPTADAVARAWTYSDEAFHLALVVDSEPLPTARCDASAAADTRSSWLGWQVRSRGGPDG